MMEIVIVSLDTGPDDLDKLLPITAKLLCKLDNPDGSEYWIAELNAPISVVNRASRKEITHLIIGARLMGESIKPNMKNMGVNIAYVLDQGMLNDSIIDFDKGEYVAIGFASDVDHKPKRKPW